MTGAFLSIVFILGSVYWPHLSVLGMDSPYLSNSIIRSDRLLLDREKIALPEKTDQLSLGPRLSAQSALVVDRSSGAILFDKESGSIRPIASISKLMTALVFLDKNPDLSSRVEMTQEDNREGGATFIRPTESASLLDYLRASLLGSANNATIVLSRQASSNPEEFVSLMNKKAKELGMAQTKFVEPTGLDVGNVGSAQDIILLLEAAYKNDLIKEITRSARAEITVYPFGRIREVKNTDQLIGSFLKILLSKTGYLDESLYNLGAVVSLDNGKEVDVVVLGSESNEARFQDVKNLSVWTQTTYKW